MHLFGYLSHKTLHYIVFNVVLLQISIETFVIIYTAVVWGETEKRGFLLSFPGILKDEMNFTQDSLLYTDLFQYSQYETQKANSTRTSMCGGQSFPVETSSSKASLGSKLKAIWINFYFCFYWGFKRSCKMWEEEEETKKRMRRES